MKLRPALMMVANGPTGLFLLDATNQTVLTVSIQGASGTKKMAEHVAAVIAELIPEDGIEVPG